MNPKDHLTSMLALSLAVGQDLRIQKTYTAEEAFKARHGAKNIKQLKRRHKSKQGRKKARRNRK